MEITRNNQPVDSAKAVSLPVLETDGSIRIVDIPYLSEEAFEFLENLLDTYKAAIVRHSSRASHAEAEASGDD